VVEDFDCVPWDHVSRFEQAARLLIQVYTLLQELAGHDAQIPLWWLMDGKSVVEEMETEDEATLRIFWLWFNELSSESKNLPIVVVQLVEIFLGHLWDKVKHG